MDRQAKPVLASDDNGLCEDQDVASNLLGFDLGLSPEM